SAGGTFGSGGDAELLLDVVPRGSDGLNLFSVFVRYLHPVFFLERHDQLDQVEGIRIQVVDERGVGRDLLGLHSELFGDDALELLVTGGVHPTPLLAVRVRSNSRRSPGQSS